MFDSLLPLCCASVSATVPRTRRRVEEEEEEEGQEQQRQAEEIQFF